MSTLTQCDRCGAIGDTATKVKAGDRTVYPNQPSHEAWVESYDWDVCDGCYGDYMKFLRAWRLAGKDRPKQVRRALARIFAGRA